VNFNVQQKNKINISEFHVVFKGTKNKYQKNHIYANAEEEVNHPL
jgi:hypothetical protein